MDKINWLEKLGWTDEQLEELRFTGFAYIRQGKYDIALDIFEALIVLDPSSLYDLQTLGAIYLQLDRPEDAINSLQESFKHEGDHTPTLINLCKALFMVDRIDEGLKLAEILQRDKDPSISNTAKALLLAFSPPK
ncbi:MAG: type III secretion chaperone [Chlamydiia bacterium]|nr:type III secretion chaperone [Chlamydiia bacterium]